MGTPNSETLKRDLADLQDEPRETPEIEAVDRQTIVLLKIGAALVENLEAITIHLSEIEQSLGKLEKRGKKLGE